MTEADGGQLACLPVRYVGVWEMARGIVSHVCNIKRNAAHALPAYTYTQNTQYSLQCTHSANDGVVATMVATSNKTERTKTEEEQEDPRPRQPNFPSFDA